MVGSICSISPSSATSAQGKGEASSLWASMRAARRVTVSRRAAETARARPASSCSAASSQAASRMPSSSRRLRLRRARSRALTRVPWSESTASTSRSRKRRRSPAEPAKRPSMAGVSQTRRRWSAKARAELTGARSMRQRRAEPPSAGSMPVPSWTRSPSLSSSSEAAQRPVPPMRARSLRSARRNPRPGVNMERASSTLVLPAPFSPVSATSGASTLRSRAA